MIPTGLSAGGVLRMAVLASVLMWRPAHACSVCFGDPNSPLVKGAAMGVLVLGGVIGFVLTGVAGTCLFWLHRSRRLAHNTDQEQAT